MDMITMTPTAALRSRSESSFVVPSAVTGYWHVEAGVTGRSSRSAVNTTLGLDLPHRTPRVEKTAVVRNTRSTAKQAAPPRGDIR